jgi:hypothetical protein
MYSISTSALKVMRSAPPFERLQEPQAKTRLCKTSPPPFFSEGGDGLSAALRERLGRHPILAVEAVTTPLLKSGLESGSSTQFLLALTNIIRRCAVAIEAHKLDCILRLHWQRVLGEHGA